MKKSGLLDKKCGTLRDLCVTLKSKVPQDNHKTEKELGRLRDLAGPSLYPIRAHARAHTCEGVIPKNVPQRPAGRLNPLKDKGIRCVTYLLQGPAKVPQIALEGPATVRNGHWRAI